jgi:phosphoglycerate kinase
MPVTSVTAAPPLKGITVLLRASLNVPVEAGAVRNPFRLDKALDTIEYLRHSGARVVLISHIDGTGLPSLRPVFEYLKKKVPLQFVGDIVGPHAQAEARALKDGEVLMLENVRRDPGEEKNDEHFARELAALGDVFVNDDFASAHRKHASIVSVPQFLPSYAGLQFIKEINGLSQALNPQSPSLAILGGAKFVTKEPLIRALLKSYDKVFVGGALADDFFKAQGHEVGKSLVSDAPGVKELLGNSKIMLPVDVTVENAEGKHEVKLVNEVTPTDTIYDAGPASLEELAPFINKAKTVIWNGPLGNFEKGYGEITEDLAKLVAGTRGTSIVGGGDTIASIQKLKIESEFAFTSTAGGAMLDFLANGTLPGIEALANAKKL